MKIFRLKKGSERRFQSGHPWVYSNEIQGSPKDVQPGEPIQMQDPAGEFLAVGYGNPSSLIFFRTVSRDPAAIVRGLGAEVAAKISAAYAHRKSFGLVDASFRWIHGEADGLPGLIIDLYRLQKGGSVAVIQCHTAGMDRVWRENSAAIQAELEKALGEPLAIVLRNDVGSRKAEGIAEEAAVLFANPKKIDLNSVTIRVRGSGETAVLYDLNLIGGQKTGFFLDQNENISQIEAFLARADLPKSVKILDLCAYVGQWSTRLTQALRARGIHVEATLVDASASALEFAAKNVERAGGKAGTFKGDVLRDLEGVQEQFDIVISDPPALIQGRKNIPQGTHAYVQLHTQALRLTKPGGVIVACSCSQLLDEEEMVKTLQKAAKRNGKSVRYFARGTQAWDHPLKVEFPEGRYLKLWAGTVDHAEK